MFHFENQKVLYLLFIIAGFILIYVAAYFIGRHRYKKYCDGSLLPRLTPKRRVVMPHLKFALAMMALACFIVAAANPQTKGKDISIRRSGVDILFCLDVSKSMNATDVKPNRLQACKLAINQCINQMSDNRVSAVAFAGHAEVVVPATTDFEAAKSIIKGLNTSRIDYQGTNLHEALMTSAMAMGVNLDESEEEAAADSNTIRPHQAIILISDGEDHAEDAVSTAKKLHDKGLLIFTIGVGSTTGVTIPDGNGIKRDETGRPVVTRLNEGILKEIAEVGGGAYVHATNVHEGFQSIFQTIDDMAKSDFGKVKLATFDTQYQYPLAAGLILLFLEGLLLVAKPQRRRKATAVILCATAILCAGCHKKTETRPNPAIAAANEKFAKADKMGDNADPYNLPAQADSLYHQAARAYGKAAQQLPNNRAECLFNLIDAFYRTGNYDTIPHIASSILNSKPNAKLRNDLAYNVGNQYLANAKYFLRVNDQNAAYENILMAIDSYKDCLRKNPKDMDAKYNLTYALKLLPKNQREDGKQAQNSEKSDQQKQQDLEENLRKIQKMKQDLQDQMKKESDPQKKEQLKKDIQKLQDIENDIKKQQQQQQQQQQKKEEQKQKNEQQLQNDQQKIDEVQKNLEQQKQNEKDAQKQQQIEKQQQQAEQIKKDLQDLQQSEKSESSSQNSQQKQQQREKAQQDIQQLKNDIEKQQQNEQDAQKQQQQQQNIDNLNQISKDLEQQQQAEQQQQQQQQQQRQQQQQQRQQNIQQLEDVEKDLQKQQDAEQDQQKKQDLKDKKEEAQQLKDEMKEQQRADQEQEKRESEQQGKEQNGQPGKEKDDQHKEGQPQNGESQQQVRKEQLKKLGGDKNGKGDKDKDAGEEKESQQNQPQSKEEKGKPSSNEQKEKQNSDMQQMERQMNALQKQDDAIREKASFNAKDKSKEHMEKDW